MKAVVCREPLRMELVDVPEPEAGPGEVVVAIRRVGICGTDLHAFHGRQPFLDYPRVLGHELAGDVDGRPVVVLPYLECGGCVACRAGKPNCCESVQVLGVHRDGGLQERLVVPASHVLSADGLTRDQSALVECLAIGAHANRRAAVAADESVLVIGAGPIGLGVMAFARARGARLAVQDVDAARLDFVRSWLPGTETFAAETVPDDFGAAVVFDVTGNPDSMRSAVNRLVHGGRMVFVGLVKGDFAVDHPSFHRREATLLASRNATREDFATVMEALRSGTVVVEPMISQRVDLAGVVAGMPAWSAPGAGLLKTIVRVGEQ